jgi:hypothetical protein
VFDLGDDETTVRFPFRGCPAASLSVVSFPVRIAADPSSRFVELEQGSAQGGRSGAPSVGNAGLWAQKRIEVRYPLESAAILP